MRTTKAAALLVLALGVSLCGPGAPSAFAASPWWSLTSGSWPTSLHSGVAKDDVQELTVNAASGDWVLGNTFELFVHKDLIEAVLPYNAQASQLQEVLAKEFPSRRVLVEEGQNDTASSHSWVVKFPAQHAPLLEAQGWFLGRFECKVLEEFGFGSCGGEPGRFFENLEGGAEVTELAAGRPDGKIVVTAENLGDEAAFGSAHGAGEPVVLEDTLPEHLQAVEVEGRASGVGFLIRGPVACSLAHTFNRVRCVFEGALLPPGEQIEMRISVAAAGASSSEENALTVSGGGASAASLTKPISVGSVNGFGVEDYEVLPQEEGGAPSTQAGVHPFELTFVTTLDTSEAAENWHEQEPAAMAKDLTFQLPPGLVGNPTPLPQCTDAQFTTGEPGKSHDECPANTALGTALITYNAGPGSDGGLTTIRVPLFNLQPRRGEPARFGFEPFPGVRVYIDTAVRSGSDYGVTAKVSNITEIAGFISSKVTFWGVPADPAHDNARGWECVFVQEGNPLQSCPAGVSQPPPFFSMPTSCPVDPHTGQPQPLLSTVQADSWAEPHPANPTEKPLQAEYEMGGLHGCNHLQFSPEIRVTPDAEEASKPTGLNVDVHVPQTSVLNAEGLAEANVKDITVALPPGVAINPAGGNGLQACSQELIGFTGFTEPGQTATFTGTLPEPLQPGVNFCPDASKIGELTVHSPLLPAPQPLKGFVYLAAQNQNPFGSLVALYLVVKDPISGTVVKLTGETRLCESAGETIDGVTCQAAGQIITTLLNTPQLAFEDGEFHFFGGERAPLASPARCGSYTTSAAFVPWSTEAGEAPRTATSTFNVTSGPNGAPCPGPTLPFSPTLHAGSSNVEAGAFAPLTTTIGREDGQQDMQSVQLSFPPGVSGSLAGVKLCPEAQANEGTCGLESLIGETTVSAGVGSDPVSVTGGKVYLTESYKGATFGLSIVNPVKAGPFDLEHDTSNPAQNPACDCIVVRGKLALDPITAALTFTSDPSGPHAIPHLIDGIPVQIKKVNVTINREHFTFNPTNCSPMSLTGTIGSDEGASSPVSVPFKVHDCAELGFKPKFSVSTTGKTSRSKGASLHVKLVYPKAPFGSQANIAAVKVDLPKALPSRLKTLQNACLAQVFAANPAGCSATSVVGHAKAITPLIPVPLEGPAYFVSHGGEAFPQLVVVLQGYGVTVHLVGDTFISKAGITSSTFRTIPDVPVGSFELTLPEGKFSALAANGNLCKGKLKMPTAFKAQNGAVIHQSTPISVTGCPKSKKSKKKK